LPLRWLASQPQIADEAQCGAGFGEGKGVYELEKKKCRRRHKGKERERDVRVTQDRGKEKSIHRVQRQNYHSPLNFET
jgi:hypothetical protein